MRNRSSLLIILQVLLVLAFASFTADARKQDAALVGQAAMDEIDFSVEDIHLRGLQFSGTDDATSKTKDPDDDDGATATDDGGSSFPTDDEAYNEIKPSLLPPEKNQPRSWPATVLIIFLALAAALLGISGFKHCKKRREYENVPSTSLVV